MDDVIGTSGSCVNAHFFVHLNTQIPSVSSAAILRMRYFFQLSKAYFGYMEVLFNNHIKFVLDLDTNTFLHIVSSLESGLKGLDTGISTQVCFWDLFVIFLLQQGDKWT
jgi:hypothetical protein